MLQMKLVLFINLLLVVCPLIVSANPNPNPKSRYGYSIVIDAGSSHTGFTLFHYYIDDLKAAKDTGSVKVVATCDKADSSISEFGEKVEDLTDYMMQCLEKFYNLVDVIEDTKVFLGATSSMRLLQVLEPEKSQKIMDKLDEIFGNSGYSFYPRRFQDFTRE